MAEWNGTATRVFHSAAEAMREMAKAQNMGEMQDCVMAKLQDDSANFGYMQASMLELKRVEINQLSYGRWLVTFFYRCRLEVKDNA